MSLEKIYLTVIFIFITLVLGFFMVREYYPVEAVTVPTPFLLDKSEYTVGEFPEGTFTIYRHRVSQPEVVTRIACSNGFYKVVNVINKGDIPPTKTTLVNQPIDFAHSIPNGAGGVCRYEYTSIQHFTFLGKHRTQDLTYSTTEFEVK